MKGGYTFSVRWNIAAAAAFVLAVIVHLVAGSKLDAARREVGEIDDKLTSQGKQLKEYSSYTGEEVQKMEARVAAVASRLIPAARADDWRWIGNGWNTHPEPGDVGKQAVGSPPRGYEKQTIVVERVGTSPMTDWGLIVTRMGEWEHTPGVCLRGVAIRATGNEAGRYFEKVSFTMDVYFAKPDEKS